MSRLIHLSDLHFGRDRQNLLQPLLSSVNDATPDIVVISGDLTQRAREREYSAARDFIARIAAPVLCVPGNHDVPVHRPLTRFLRPYHYYRRYISPELAPVHTGEDVIVVGINTVDRFKWQTGRLSRGRARRACTALSRCPDLARVVVAHHPLDHPKRTKKKPIPGARRALATLMTCGADIILSGHLHLWHASAFAHTTATGDQHTAIQLHAGTSLSSRGRGEPNDFNILDIAPRSFRIARQSYDDQKGRFETAETRHFDRVSGRFMDGDAP